MNPSKRKMYAVLAGVGISLGAAGIASAASSSTVPRTAAATASAIIATSTPTDPTTDASTASTADTTTTTGTATTTDSADPAGAKKDDTPAYTSSVTVAVPTDGSEPTATALQAVATVTAAQATTAALANTPGTATAPVLKSVAGNVVWEVDVTATTGGSSDVVVDAGNSKILDSHVEGGRRCGNGGHHGDATPAYTSSVTVAVPTDGSEPTATALQAVATVTAAQATTAALANTPGTATAPVLKSVAGNVVWEVDVTATTGGSSDVVVDAGNSKILDSHVEGGRRCGNGGHHGDDDAAAPAATTTAGA